MSYFSRCMRFLIPAVVITGMVSCFKEKFPVAGLPDDTAGDTVTSSSPVSQIRKKILIIGIDGCRGDAMRMADAPNIRGLLPHAIYSFDALTQAPTLGGPCWASLLTGVWSDQLGVTDNTFAGNNFLRYPMVYKYIKALNPALRTVSICSWSPINSHIVTNADVKISPDDNDAAVKDSAVARLTSDSSDIMLVDFHGVDDAGSRYGYDTAATPYLQAITTVDGYVGQIMQALNSRPTLGNEDWLVILASDHGGIGTSGGGDTYPEKNIFTLFYNQHFTSTEIIPPANTLKAVNFQNVGEYAYSTDPVFNFDSIRKFTVQIEVKTPALSSDVPFFTNKNWGSGGNAGWVLAINGQGWKFNAGDGSGHRVDVTASGVPALNDGAWHTLTVTIDRAGDANLYQDGVPCGNTGMVAVTTLNPQAVNKLVIADDITGTYKQNYGNPAFSAANVRIWDTIWSQSDLQQYSQCDTTVSSGNPYDGHLVGWWRGTDGSGSTWKDISGRQSDMMLKGDAGWQQQQSDFCNVPLPPSVPTIVDIAPCILSWLSINIDPGWGLSGRSWLP